MAIDGTLPVTPAEGAGATSAAVLGPDERTTAQWLMPIAALVEALIAINVMLSIGFIPPLVAFTAILVVVAVLGFVRPGPRLFLVGGVVLLLFVGLNLPFAIEGLIDPTGSSHAWTDIIAIVVGITGGIAGIAAFVELRRPAWRSRHAPRSARGVLAVLVVGSSSGRATSRSGGTAHWRGRRSQVVTAC
jgi:hypothetical protein